MVKSTKIHNQNLSAYFAQIKHLMNNWTCICQTLFTVSTNMLCQIDWINSDLCFTLFHKCMVYGRNNKSFVLPVTILVQPIFFFHMLVQCNKYMFLVVGIPSLCSLTLVPGFGFLLLFFSIIVFHITHSLYSSKPLSLVPTYSHYQHYQLSFACSLKVTSAYWPTQHTRESKKSFNQQQIWKVKKWLLLCVRVHMHTCMRVRKGERQTFRFHTTSPCTHGIQGGSKLNWCYRKHTECLGTFIYFLSLTEI